MTHRKTTILSITLLATFLLGACLVNSKYAAAIPQNESEVVPMAWYTSPDSGYINKKDGMLTLLAASLTDSALWNDYSYIDELDTVGRYYRIPESENLLACIYAPATDYRVFWMLQLSPDGILTRVEDFGAGLFGCCCSRQIDKFGMVGSYFYFAACGTGSGHCSKQLQLFKTLLPLDSISSLPAYLWDSGFGNTTYLNSTYTLQGDSLIVHYTTELGRLEFDDDDTDKDPTYTVLEANDFDILYLYNSRSGFLMADSSDLRKLEPFLF